MPYKGTVITKQIMRVKKKPLVTDMRDVVEDPEFPLLTKKQPISVPERPKNSVREERVPEESATSSSQAAKKQEPSTAQPKAATAIGAPASNSEGE